MRLKNKEKYCTKVPNTAANKAPHCIVRASLPSIITCDFSDKEIKLIEENNMIIPISLGNSVLKSETACIVASSLIKELSNHA